MRQAAAPDPGLEATLCAALRACQSGRTFLDHCEARGKRGREDQSGFVVRTHGGTG